MIELVLESGRFFEMTDNNAPQELNLDLIQRVQQARMMNDAQAIPSQVKGIYWIEAKAPNPQPTRYAGAWVIQTDLAAVDALWAQVKAQTVAGALGYKSKVSTAAGKNQGRATDRQIQVKIADSRDEAARERVFNALRALGIEASAMHFQVDVEGE